MIAFQDGGKTPTNLPSKVNSYKVPRTEGLLLLLSLLTFFSNTLIFHLKFL